MKLEKDELLNEKLFVRSKGVFFYDDINNKYIDCGISYFTTPLGHCNSEVNNVIIGQLNKLTTLPLISKTNEVENFSHEIISVSPIKNSDVVFATTGAEAIELSMDIFNVKTPITFINGFHGCSYNLNQIRHSLNNKLLFPDCLKCHFNQKCNKNEFKCLNAIFDKQVCNHFDGVIVEPILGAGGGIIPPKGWFKELRKICDEKNIPLIIDEIQTGFGRTGKLFAIEYEDIIPDVIVCGKSITNGTFPLYMVITKKENLNSYNYESTTFAGNPMACVIGSFVLKTINTPLFLTNILNNSSRLMLEIPGYGNANFRGLMGGLHFFNETITETFRKNLLLNGILTISGLTRTNIRIQPPLCINNNETHELIEKINESLKNLQGSVRTV